MLKPLFLFVLFSALAPLTHAQRIVLNPGESQSINGIMVSCGGNYGGGGYGMTACERMARLDNDN